MDVYKILGVFSTDTHTHIYGRERERWIGMTEYVSEVVRQNWKHSW